MRISIIGGGSIGLLYSAYLAEQFDVTIYTRSESQANLINDVGILVKKNNLLVKQVYVKATTSNRWQGNEDLAIITVKQYDLPVIIEQINKFKNVHMGSLLFLQNGMGHLAAIEKLTTANIGVGVVEHGALRLNNYTVEHTGNGLTRLAKFRGDFGIFTKLITAWAQSFSFVEEKDYRKMLEKKLIVNLMINPLTAILKVRNGALVENKYYYKLFKQLYGEVSQIFSINNNEEVFNYVLSVCKQTANNKSSMYKDIIEGRQTELEAIVGYALQVARQNKLATPILATLYMMLKGSECARGGAYN